MPDNQDDRRRLGHKRPWWDFNVLTLLASLFVLVWIRYLFDLQQGATIMLTLMAIFGWILLGAFAQPVRTPLPPPGLRQRAHLAYAADNWSAPHVPPPPPWHVPLDVRRLEEVPAFTTKDGSEIRELLAFRNSCIRWQSLAEARLPPGASTTPHYHPRTEEIYYILAGSGRMVLEKTVEDVGPGDAIAIPPGSRHQITNIGDELLTFLCCCVPAYEHDDTILVERWPEETDEAEGPLDAAEQPAANDPFDPFV
jgi:mannose-6-phosphate isomerase-like protein (cupin superfamily)